MGGLGVIFLVCNTSRAERSRRENWSSCHGIKGSICTKIVQIQKVVQPCFLYLILGSHSTWFSSSSQYKRESDLKETIFVFQSHPVPTYFLSHPSERPKFLAFPFYAIPSSILVPRDYMHMFLESGVWRWDGYRRVANVLALHPNKFKDRVMTAGRKSLCSSYWSLVGRDTSQGSP